MMDLGLMEGPWNYWLSSFCVLVFISVPCQILDTPLSIKEESGDAGSVGR